VTRSVLKSFSTRNGAVYDAYDDGNDDVSCPTALSVFSHVSWKRDGRINYLLVNSRIVRATSDVDVGD